MVAVDRGGELPLAGGRQTPGVVRVGNTVRRPVGPNSSFVHHLLHYLEDVGFEGAPGFSASTGVTGKSYLSSKARCPTAPRNTLATKPGS